MKQKLKSGDEVDVVCARNYYNFGRGVTKKIKRILNKRFRKQSKEEINGYKEER